jgi:hypothetical protein
LIFRPSSEDAEEKQILARGAPDRNDLAAAMFSASTPSGAMRNRLADSLTARWAATWVVESFDRRGNPLEEKAHDRRHGSREK